MHPIVQTLVEYGIDPRDAADRVAMHFMAQALVLGQRQPVPPPVEPQTEAPTEPEAPAEPETDAQGEPPAESE
jgi:hypothetical protein